MTNETKDVEDSKRLIDMVVDAVKNRDVSMAALGMSLSYLVALLCKDEHGIRMFCDTTVAEWVKKDHGLHWQGQPD